MNFWEASLASVAFVRLKIAPIYTESVKGHYFKK
jgi:hypothetical protein